MLLHQWIRHRLRVVRLGSARALAERAGVDAADVDVLLGGGDLASLAWSAQRAVAGALRVALKWLWAVADGARWVDDREYYDADAAGRPPPGREAEWRRARRAAEDDRGTPVIGDVRGLCGRLEVDDDWNPWDGRRLPARYGAGHEVFATGRRDRPSEFAVWRMQQAAEVALGNRYAVFVSDGFGGGVGYDCRLCGCRGDPGKFRLAFEDGEELNPDRELVVRVAKPIAAFPPPDGAELPAGAQWAAAARGGAGGRHWEADAHSQDFPNYDAGDGWRDDD